MIDDETSEIDHLSWPDTADSECEQYYVFPQYVFSLVDYPQTISNYPCGLPCSLTSGAVEPNCVLDLLIGSVYCTGFVYALIAKPMTYSNQHADTYMDGLQLFLGMWSIILKFAQMNYCYFLRECYITSFHMGF